MGRSLAPAAKRPAVVRQTLLASVGVAALYSVYMTFMHSVHQTHGGAAGPHVNLLETSTQVRLRLCRVRSRAGHASLRHGSQSACMKRAYTAAFVCQQ